jgi:hypothetical protein
VTDIADRQISDGQRIGLDRDLLLTGGISPAVALREEPVILLL